MSALRVCVDEDSQLLPQLPVSQTDRLLAVLVKTVKLERCCRKVFVQLLPQTSSLILSKHEVFFNFILLVLIENNFVFCFTIDLLV